MPPSSDAAASRLARAALVLLVAWLFRETLIEGGVFYRRDILLVWYPQVESFVRALAAGSWPVWNPSLSFGQPLLADPSAQILYPPTWLNLVVRPWHYYTLYVAGHALLAALGLFALARHWGLSVAGSLVAAALWALSGPYLSYADLWHHFAGASWIPLAVLAADRALTTRRRSAVIAWALVEAGQILAGSADMCVLTLLFVGGLVLAKHVVYRPLSDPSNRSLVARAALGMILAVGLTAGLWLPALDIVSRAARSDLPSAIRTYWSVHPAVLPDLLVPALVSGLPLAPSLRSAFFESREPLLGSLYLGGASLGLVTAALALSGHRLKLLLAVTGVVALLVALGSHTGVYGAAVFLLPPLRILRYPVKVMILVALCWSLLAGMGFDAWRDRQSRGRWIAGVAAPLLLLCLFDLAIVVSIHGALEAWAVRLAVPEGMTPQSVLRPTQVRLLIASGVVAIVIALALTRSRRPAWASALAAAMGVVAVGEIAAFHRYPNRTAPRALATYRPEVLNAIRGESVRLYVYDYGEPGPSAPREGAYRLKQQPEGWDLEAASALGMQMYLAPESIGRWGLRGSYEIDYRGLYPDTLARASRLLRASEGTPAHLRLLRIGAVTHVLTLHEGFDDLVQSAVLPGLFERPIRLLEVPAPLPRAYVVGSWRVAPPVEALRLLAESGMDPAREAVLSEGNPHIEEEAFEGEAWIVADRPDRVRVGARLSRRGLLVLVDGYDPGWTATVDGRPVPVLRANGLYRAVVLDPGKREVEFVYRPRPVFLGLGIALATALGIAAMVLAGRRREPSAPPPGDGVP